MCKMCEEKRVEMEEKKVKIKQVEKNICQALEDYARYTDDDKIMSDARRSENFIQNLARDSYKAKQNLRKLFSKSPAWNPELDAIVINGNRTRDTDWDSVEILAMKILGSALKQEKISVQHYWNIIHYFSQPKNVATQNIGVETINRIAPKAYAEGKKPSRIFKAICKELGIADETSGSEFQKLYAELADELSAKKIDFKLFVSINPAHFLTMSNPKGDNRGTMLTSCHSLNSTDYEYNNGCTGYARDNTSFIVFTVADPNNPELLNNRKTSRQIFAYEPGNGVLLQSRFYNTQGGTSGAVEEGKVYRDLIQRELSDLEQQPNLWKTFPSHDKDDKYVKISENFGGYADWTYADFDGKISIRDDRKNSFHPIEVGAYGLCVSCGKETRNGVYCCWCNKVRCDDCGEHYNEEDLVQVGRNGEQWRVCPDCFENYYRCDHCEEYHHVDNMYFDSNDTQLCEDCYDKCYEICEECNNIEHSCDVIKVEDFGCVCSQCLGHLISNGTVAYCEECEEYHLMENITRAINEYETETFVCDSCLGDSYHYCNNCGTWIHDEWNECPNCVEEKEKIA